jgi:hypothetical protein
MTCRYDITMVQRDNNTSRASTGLHVPEGVFDRRYWKFVQWCWADDCLFLD